MNQTKLYNGEVNISFDPDKHKYYWNEKEVDGVTTVFNIISKPQLIPWAVNTDLQYARNAIIDRQPESLEDFDQIFKEAKGEHNRIKSSAADKGTGVHKLIEDWAGAVLGLPEYIASGDAVILPAESKKFDLFLKWYQENKVQVVSSEQRVFSKKNLYCGTMDLLLRWKGKLYVGDIKTNSVKPPRKTGIYFTYWLQTAAYQNACEEETKEKIFGRVIVRLGDDGIEVATSTKRKDYLEDKKAFLGALTLYRRNKEYEVNRS